MAEKLTRKELLAIHSHLCHNALNLMAKKNYDYAGGKDADDAMKNFRMAAIYGICPNLQASVLIRLSDKIARLATLVQNKEKVTEESFKDTILDVINYGVLLYGAHVEETGRTGSEQTPDGGVLEGMGEVS